MSAPSPDLLISMVSENRTTEYMLELRQSFRGIKSSGDEIYLVFYVFFIVPRGSINECNSSTAVTTNVVVETLH